MSDKFWFEDPSILIKENRLHEFIPIKDMTTIEKLNAIMRLTIIISICLFLLNKKMINMLLIFFIKFRI